jgi:hypothetical protein
VQRAGIQLQPDAARRLKDSLKQYTAITARLGPRCQTRIHENGGYSQIKAQQDLSNPKINSFDQILQKRSPFLPTYSDARRRPLPAQSNPNKSP